MTTKIPGEKGPTGSLEKEPCLLDCLGWRGKTGCGLGRWNDGTGIGLGTTVVFPLAGKHVLKGDDGTTGRRRRKEHDTQSCSVGRQGRWRRFDRLERAF
jgi:hypothetical protein